MHVDPANLCTALKRTVVKEQWNAVGESDKFHLGSACRLSRRPLHRHSQSQMILPLFVSFSFSSTAALPAPFDNGDVAVFSLLEYST